MNSNKRPLLRVNIYAQNDTLAQHLKQEFEAVAAFVAVNKKFNKSFFTGKNSGNLPQYIVALGEGRDLEKIIKFAQISGVKLLIVLPLITPSQKVFQKSVDLVASLPRDIFCKVVWLGGDPSVLGNNFSENFDYYLIAPQDAANCIRRIIFSFWSKRVEEYSVTDKIPGHQLIGKFTPNKNTGFYQGRIKGKIITPKTNTLARFRQPLPFKHPKQKSPKLFPKKLVSVALILIFILSSPFLLLVGAQGLFWAGSKTFEQNPTQAQKLFSRAHSLSNLSFMLIPLPSTKRLSDTSLVGKHTALSLETLQSIVTGVFGGGGWDVEKLTDRLKVNLDRVYTLASFMEERDIFRQKLLLATKLTSRLPALIGQSIPKTYLLLLQDSSQIRPTGGKIESFALVSFQGGELVDTEIYTPADIDNQIKGLVPAPIPLQNYLGGERWSFADANWDPDFELTAQKLNWFLEKSMDRKIDGTVAITQNLAKAEDAQKALTQIIEKIKQDVLQEPLVFSLGFLEQIKNKNVQFFLNDTLTQEALDGVRENRITPRSGIWLGLYESNLSQTSEQLDKSNLLTIKLDGESTKTQVQTTLINNNLESDYKGYFRLIVPTGVSFGKIKILEEGRVIKSLNPEIVGRTNALEAGVYVEIPKGGKRDILFEYNQLLPLDLDGPGSVDVYWQKQAGEVVPLSVVIDLTNGREYRYNTLSEEDFFQKINL